MGNQKISNWLFIIGVFVFQILFWKEGQGLNLVFFTIFSLITLIFQDVNRWKSTYFKISAIGTTLLSLFVVLNHSDVSIICFWLSWLTLVGLSYGHDLYYLLYALMQGIENLLFGTKNIKQIFTWESNTNDGFVPEKATGLRPSLFAIPVGILALFVLMYMVGNQDFANNIANILTAIFKNLDWLWDLFSFRWLLFLALAVFVIGGLVWKNSGERWSAAQLGHNMDILPVAEIPTMTQVNDRYWTAFLTLAMLNVLIFVVNIQDFFKMLSPQDISASNLRFSVHFGTYALVFSIAVAMALLFYFFKNDLNFIEKSSSLRLLSYIWIAQNAIMVLAVFARNYLYISHHGLAYKRIGVVFFLILVLIGLYTMVLKVKNQKTFTHLFHLNTWAVYGIFIVISAINWDNFITNYNLQNTDRDKLDAAFLFNDISDKNLKTLYDYQNLLPAKVTYKESGFWSSNTYEMDTKTLLEQKKNLFLERMKGGQSFLSWNYPDAQNLEVLK